MNYVVVVASGRGTRMGQSVPKQFMTVNDKPVILYTLEGFQNNKNVDAMIVVITEEWRLFVESYISDNNISKVLKIVDGGESVQESLYAGVSSLDSEQLTEDDLIIVHDGVRPIVNEDILNIVISDAKKYGQAVSSVPIKDQIQVIDSDSDSDSSKFLDRTRLVKVTTPQAYNAIWLQDMYKEALREKVGFEPSDYTNTMLLKLGVTLHLSSGSDKNLKLTTKEDLDIFNALISLDEV
ncbi:hypothetical protein BMS87_07690 [Leuconostoc pseudomesenteroides]|nr:hypothetical protein BMS86_07735 [Leuconostoc pseudomesenteroides]ORI54865.1 hypothetical protein BMS87_07690 [Leuconostoc pseudomesenteroides]